MNLKKLAVIMLAGISTVCLTTSCSSKKKCDHDCEIFYAKYIRVVQEREAKAQRVEKEPTLRHRKWQLGGAAIRQNAYVHVLDNDNNLSIESADKVSQSHNSTVYGVDFDDLVSILNDWDMPDNQPTNNEVREVIESSEIPQPIILNEITNKVDFGRWERYCNSGYGMNEKDWNFVREKNYQVPATLEKVCSKPDFTYNEYIDAWGKFCQMQHVTKKEQKIIKNTVRPISLYNSCKALSNSLERTYKK